ncbi:MAG: 30S ribosome-binding factor RbfA [Planctomycetota bacterium]
MQERRLHRLESLIKERVATLLLRDMADPRLGLVTITRVKVDRELSSCKIYWSVLGDEKQRRLNERTLAHAAGFVRREIASVLHTRSVPQVTFVFDESVTGALRVDAILKELREARRDEPDADEDADAASRPDGRGDSSQDAAEEDEATVDLDADGGHADDEADSEETSRDDDAAPRDHSAPGGAGS